MDLLKYSDTVLHVCLGGKDKRVIHDILRQIYVVRTKIRVCPCVTDVWVRKTLEFLNAVYDNEPSSECLRHGANRELSAGTTESTHEGDQSSL